jgi:hypothetical protein
VWSEIDQNSVFDGSILSRLATLARTRTHLHGNESLRGLLTGALPERIEDLAVPFQCVAASIEQASEHLFTAGPLGDHRPRVRGLASRGHRRLRAAVVPAPRQRRVLRRDAPISSTVCIG